jgi:hypothetical protein
MFGYKQPNNQPAILSLLDEMKPFLCFLLLSFPLFQACGEGDAWSKSDKGLRGRLVVLPAEKPDSPFCRVFIELQNTEEVMGQRKVRFKPEKLDFQVTDQDGNVLVRANGSYDGITPGWEPILLPYAGTIKFQISFNGLGYHPDRDRIIVDLGPSRSWIIPPTGDYFLTGTFSVAREPGDHPIMDWSGTLTFPPAKIQGVR